MKFIITATFSYKGAKNIPFTSDDISEDQVLFVYEELQKTGRFSTLTIEDIHGTSYTPKMLRKRAEKTDEIKEINIYIDGAFDKQTKQGGEGIVIYYKKGKQTFRYRESVYLHYVENNNEAEWLALEKCIQVLAEQELTSCRYVTVYTDSKSTVEIYNENWPVYGEKELAFWNRISAMISKCKLDITVEYIPRNENQEAHRLSQQGLERKEHISHIEVEER